MMRRIVRRHITATPERVVQAVLDWSQWPRWRPGLDEVRNVSDEPILNARVWHESRSLGGRKMTLLARAVEVDSPRAFAYVARGDGLEAVFRWTARWGNERALIVQETGVRATGLRNLLSGAAKSFLAQQDAALDQLRLLFPTIENKPARDAP